MIYGDKVQAQDFLDLKKRVKAEMKRRCQNGSLQQYAKPAYDFDENDTPATNDIIKAKTIEKIIVPLNQIQEQNMDYSNGSLIKALNTIESNLTTYESRQMKYKGATDCATQCSGLCTSGCYNACQGCSSSCQSSCKAGDCYGNCSATCANSCDANNCVGQCGGQCQNVCKGNTAATCSNCSSNGCFGQCSNTCTGGCKGTCTGNCGDAACTNQCGSSCARGGCTGTNGTACPNCQNNCIDQCGNSGYKGNA